MKIKLFILVPSLENTGPIKGAIALANNLKNDFKVTFVVLKKKGNIDYSLDPSIKIKKFYSAYWNIFYWRKKYKNLILSEKKNKRLISLSFCFSADLVNYLVRENIITVSSIRANILKDYYFNYGYTGFLLALYHFNILKKFHYTIAMTKSMSMQIKKFTNKNSLVIGNFIDEIRLNKFKRTKIKKNKNITHLISVCSLTKRKRPFLLVQIVKKLLEQNQNIKLVIIGDGPLRNEINNYIIRNNLNKSIKLKGTLNNPYREISQSDYFILPSESEGISRAALEALYLGKPCLLRDVDGNRELITNKTNGLLFKDDKEMFKAILRLMKIKNSKKKSLLPTNFTKKLAIQKHTSFFREISND